MQVATRNSPVSSKSRDVIRTSDFSAFSAFGSLNRCEAKYEFDLSSKNGMLAYLYWPQRSDYI